MTKIKISTLKNQAAFDLANKVGKKQSGRFFILVSHLPDGDRNCENNSQNFAAPSILQSPNVITTKYDMDPLMDSPLGCPHPSGEEGKAIEKSPATIYLGLKVSKKMGNAVARNKIRRRIKQMFRGVARKLPGEMWESRVFIVIPRRGFDAAVYSEIEKDLTWHVKKIVAHKVDA